MHICIVKLWFLPCGNPTSEGKILRTDYGQPSHWCDWTRIDRCRPNFSKYPAQGPVARRAHAAPSDRVTKLMTAAAHAGPLPASVSVQDSEVAQQRYSWLKRSNSHPFQNTNASILFLPTAPYLEYSPEGIESVLVLRSSTST